MKLRALLYELLQALWLIPFGIIAPVTMWSRRLALRPALLWVGGNLKLLEWVCNIRTQLSGEENIPDGPVIFASKHQSTLDTYLLLFYQRGPSFVLKESLLKIPVFGWYLWRLGPVAIDRKAGSQALKKIRDIGQKRLDQGLPVVIFPEGTRKAPDAPTDYQPAGIFTLYKLGVPVVPVALNTGTYWPKKWFVKHSGTAKMRYLEPIAPGLNKRDFMALLEERIEAGCKAL
jgi:1-acyl-sn-glycerol-3-phosphate acyltransferase